MPCYTQVLNRHFPAAPRGVIPMRNTSSTALSAASVLRQAIDRKVIHREVTDQR